MGSEVSSEMTDLLVELAIDGDGLALLQLIGEVLLRVPVEELPAVVAGRPGYTQKEPKKSHHK